MSPYASSSQEKGPIMLTKMLTNEKAVLNASSIELSNLIACYAYSKSKMTVDQSILPQLHIEEILKLLLVDGAFLLMLELALFLKRGKMYKLANYSGITRL